MFSMRAFTSWKPKNLNTKSSAQPCEANKTSHAKIERETHLSLKQIHSQLTNESHTKVSNIHNRKRAMCCNQVVEMAKPSASKRRQYSTFNATTKKTTILDLKKKYNSQAPITMVTAYDYTSATNVDNAGIDMILVGDSLGMVMLGYSNTTSVTMEDMIHHCKAVARGSKRAFIVGDMPFGSYEVSPEDAVKNAIRLMKEGSVEAVKMEGGRRVKESIKAVVNAGIPVIGHIGLTPQTQSALGGFRVQAKTAEAAQQLLADALELQQAGVTAIVIESVPDLVAAYITKQLSVPTIGIGAGNGTSGQVLVFHDMLGLYQNFVPKFCKQYASLSQNTQTALQQYKEEVEARSFPTPQHSYSIKMDELIKAFPDATQVLNVSPVETIQPKKTEEQVSKKAAETLNVCEQQPIIKKKRIAVLGGGAMGSLMGGRLAATGNHDVWMLTSWKEHIDKINKVGLTIRNLDKTIQNIPLRATSSVNEILSTAGPVDLAVVLVKGPQTQQAAESAAKLIDKQGFVLTLQNGMGNREIIAKIVGDETRVVQGVTSQGSYLVDSGHVMHTGLGNTTLAFNPLHSSRVKEIAEMLWKAGIPTEITDDLDSMLWAKLIVNAGINPLTAILRVKNGVIASSSSCREILSHVVDEAVNVAKARGVKLPYTDAEHALASVLQVARATSENFSSMLVDIMRGSQTEIDNINGAIVREGDKHGIPVTFNRTMLGLLSAFDTKPSKLKLGL